jgi:hypothetical protein
MLWSCPAAALQICMASLPCCHLPLSAAAAVVTAAAAAAAAVLTAAAGDRFCETYYWDSYWMIRGLLVSGMTQSGGRWGVRWGDGLKGRM